MAEGGEEENNPFSFKKFVKSKDKPVEKRDEEDSVPRNEPVTQPRGMHWRENNLNVKNCSHYARNLKKKLCVYW